MSENIPDPGESGENNNSNQLPRTPSAVFDLDAPEPDDTASVRAERGSPTPSCVTVDQPLSLPDPRPSSLAADSGSSSITGAPSEPIHPSLPGDIPADPEFHDPNAVSSELLAQLLNIGFDELISTIALQRTANSTVEEAVNWIIDHSNPSDLDEDSSDGEEDEEEDTDEPEMGAASSTSDGGPGQPSGSAVEENALMKAIRAAQKSSRTHKMVLVANMGLKMGSGKLAAQVGHATLAVYRQAMSCENGQNAVDSWMRHGQVKIVVKGQNTEQLIDLFKTAKDAGCFAYLVQDAGYTQIPPGSRTVLGVFGEKDLVDSVTGKLRLL